MRDHALGEQARERLLDRQQALVLQGAGDEAGVQQVQDRVLDAADVLVDRHPVVRGFLAHGLGGLGVGEAGEVPAAVDEGVQRVGLALGLGAAGRTGGVTPGRVTQQRIAGLVEGDVLGEGDRQLVFRHGHDAAGLAVDDRDRATPIALARDAPVAQAINGRAFALAGRLDAGHGLGLGGLDVHAVQELRIEDLAGADIGLLADREGRRILAVGQNHRQDRQVVLAGEVQVALIVGRAGEDRARAVVHQDEVGDPDGQGD